MNRKILCAFLGTMLTITLIPISGLTYATADSSKIPSEATATNEPSNAVNDSTSSGNSSPASNNNTASEATALEPSYTTDDTGSNAGDVSAYGNNGGGNGAGDSNSANNSAKGTTNIDPTKTEESNVVETLADPQIGALASGKYYIRAAVSDTRVFDIASGSKINCANVQLYESNTTPAQLFEFIYDAQTGYYTIKNVGSGLVLDVASGLARNENNVWQYSSNNTLAQKWIITKLTDGSYKIASALNKNFVLDVSGSKNTNGANIQLYTYNNTKAQAFVMMPPSVPATSVKTIENGRYVITSTLAGSRVFDVPVAKDSNGIQLQTYTANKSVAQVFEIRYESDGFYSIRTLNSGSYLSAAGDGIVATTALIQWSKTQEDGQRWAIVDNGNGTYTFIGKRSGLAIDIVGAAAKDGTKLQLYYQNQSNAQNFKISPYESIVLEDGIANIVPYTQMRKCFDVAGASRNSGADVQAYFSNGTQAQKFYVKRQGNENYTLQSINSGLYLTDSGSHITQTVAPSNAPSATQLWTAGLTFGGFTLTNVSTGKAITLTAGGQDGHDLTSSALIGVSSQAFRYVGSSAINMGMYTIATSGNKLVDSKNGQSSAGTNTQIWSNNGTAAQKWRLTDGDDDYFSIRCVRSYRALDIENGSTANSANVRLWDYNASNAQLWRAVPSGDGWFYLQSKSGMYLSTAGNGAADGQNIRVTNSASTATKFRFNPTSYTGPSGTFIDVDISSQKMQYYKDGILILDCDVVTGRPGMSTPTGNFTILYKQAPAVLRGPGYASPVSYWMPFTSMGHGFHDATWQSAFGGSRYVSGYGSHGCVNMPKWAAGVLYKNVASGTRVMIHK